MVKTLPTPQDYERYPNSNNYTDVVINE